MLLSIDQLNLLQYMNIKEEKVQPHVKGGKGYI